MDRPIIHSNHASTCWSSFWMSHNGPSYPSPFFMPSSPAAYRAKEGSMNLSDDNVRYCKQMMMLCESQGQLWRLILSQLKTVEALHNAQGLAFLNAAMGDNQESVTSSILVQIRHAEGGSTSEAEGGRRPNEADGARQRQQAEAAQQAIEAGAEMRRRLSMVLRVFFLAFVLDISINGYYLVLAVSVLYLMRLDEFVKKFWQSRGAPGAGIGARPSLDVQLNKLDRLQQRRAKRDELVEQEKEKRSAAVNEEMKSQGKPSDGSDMDNTTEERERIYQKLYGSSPTPEEMIDEELRPHHKKSWLARFIYQLPVMLILTIIPEWSPNPDYLT